MPNVRERHPSVNRRTRSKPTPTSTPLLGRPRSAAFIERLQAAAAERGGNWWEGVSETESGAIRFLARYDQDAEAGDRIPAYVRESDCGREEKRRRRIYALVHAAYSQAEAAACAAPECAGGGTLVAEDTIPLLGLLWEEVLEQRREVDAARAVRS